jgi:hypothetical protein
MLFVKLRAFVGFGDCCSFLTDPIFRQYSKLSTNTTDDCLFPESQIRENDAQYVDRKFV